MGNQNISIQEQNMPIKKSNLVKALPLNDQLLKTIIKEAFKSKKGINNDKKDKIIAERKAIFSLQDYKIRMLYEFTEMTLIIETLDPLMQDSINVDNLLLNQKIVRHLILLQCYLKCSLHQKCDYHIQKCKQYLKEQLQYIDPLQNANAYRKNALMLADVFYFESNLNLLLFVWNYDKALKCLEECKKIKTEMLAIEDPNELKQFESQEVYDCYKKINFIHTNNPFVWINMNQARFQEVKDEIADHLQQIEQFENKLSKFKDSTTYLDLQIITIETYNQQAWYLGCDQFKYNEGLEWAIKNVEKCQKYFLYDNFLYLESRQVYGWVSIFSQNEDIDAIKYNREYFEDVKRIFGQMPQEQYIHALNNLSNALNQKEMAQGGFSLEGLKHQEQSLQFFEMIMGKEQVTNPNFNQLLANLANIYKDKKEFSKALSIYKKCIKNYENAKIQLTQEMNKKLADFYYNAGYILGYDLKNKKEANYYYKKSMHLFQDVLHGVEEFKPWIDFLKCNITDEI